jgi:hypothetical protein
MAVLRPPCCRFLRLRVKRVVVPSQKRIWSKRWNQSSGLATVKTRCALVCMCRFEAKDPQDSHCEPSPLLLGVVPEPKPKPKPNLKSIMALDYLHQQYDDWWLPPPVAECW